MALCLRGHALALGNTKPQVEARGQSGALLASVCPPCRSLWQSSRFFLAPMGFSFLLSSMHLYVCSGSDHRMSSVYSVPQPPSSISFIHKHTHTHIWKPPSRTWPCPWLPSRLSLLLTVPHVLPEARCTAAPCYPSHSGGCIRSTNKSNSQGRPPGSSNCPNP